MSAAYRLAVSNMGADDVFRKKVTANKTVVQAQRVTETGSPTKVASPEVLPPALGINSTQGEGRRKR